MKFNKWTVALAAVGVVSLASAARADEHLSQVQTALSNTTISGYVDVSAQWNLGTGNLNNPPYAFGGMGKSDGFNLNVVDIALDKPMDESQWASGYHVELWLGPDGSALGAGSSSFAIRQAYVALRTPVGNGINWKVGVFDSPIGYESLSSPNNPNYTHSYGFTMEPTTLTGVLASYKVGDMLSLSAGIANTFGPTINGRASMQLSTTQNESFKTYFGSATLTAPDSWGWLKGSTLSAGVINGFNSAASLNEDSAGNGAHETLVYVGTTLATPVTGLKVGAAMDFSKVHSNAHVLGEGGENDGTDWAWTLYGTYQATEKLSFSGRGEFVVTSSEALDDTYDTDMFDHNHIYAFTATAQYDLWQNVVSRVEFRWDHAEHYRPFGNFDRDNAYMLALNLIYQF